MRFASLPLLLLATTSFAQIDTARTIATINGEEIKGAEYYRRMEYLGGVGKQLGRVYTELPPGLWTLDTLITEKLVLQLAKEKGVFPSDLEVTKEIESRTAQDPQYLTRYRSSGRTDEELRGEIRYGIAQYKLQTYGITITDGEIDAYYKSAPERFTTPKRLKLRVIAVGTEGDKALVDADLSKGTPFSKVAEARSLDASKSRGGEYATIPEDALAPAMKTAVGGLKKGQVSAWVETAPEGQKAYVKFLVDDILPAEKQKLDADLRREVRREMALQRGRIKNDLQKELKDLRRKAKIDIAAPEFAKAYEAFIKQYLGDGLPTGNAGGAPGK